MDNLDWKFMTEDELVLFYKPMIAKVINSCFSNYREYLRVHMFSYEEIEQFGMIGIMEASRTFDESKGTKFKTHVVNRIKYAIINYSKEVSLRNKNNYSSELLNLVSLNYEVIQDDGWTDEMIYHLSADYCDYEEVDNEMFIKNCITKLINEKTISKEYIAFLLLKMNGHSINKISKIFNTSFYYVETVLNKYKQQASELLNLGESFNEFK